MSTFDSKPFKIMVNVTINLMVLIWRIQDERKSKNIFKTVEMVTELVLIKCAEEREGED